MRTTRSTLYTQLSQTTRRLEKHMLDESASKSATRCKQSSIWMSVDDLPASRCVTPVAGCRSACCARRNRRHRRGNREQGTGNREQGTGSRESLRAGPERTPFDGLRVSRGGSRRGRSARPYESPSRASGQALSANGGGLGGQG